MISDLIIQDTLLDITDDEKGSVSIVECILNGKTSELEISEATEIKVTKVRKVLYKLYDAGVVTYKRTKDPETNWDIYNWKFDENKVSNIIAEKNEKYSQEIEKSIKYEEENMFFACKTNGHRYKFEKATEMNFVCPKCGETLEHQDNSAIIAKLLTDKDQFNSLGKN